MRRDRQPHLLMQNSRMAFTLIEVMVVIGIIALLVAVSVPAIGPLLSSNEAAQVRNTLGGVFSTAQSAAEANSTPVAIRIERAFNPKRFTFNKQPYQALRDFTKPSDQPSFLPFQQARLLKLTSEPPDPGVAAKNEPYQPAFEDLPDARVTPLPKSAWIAPIECIDRDPSNGNPVKDPADTSRQLWTLEDKVPGMLYDPKYVPKDPNGTGNDAHAVQLNRMDTFYIIFDRQGTLHQFETSPGDATLLSRYWYRDRTQPYEDPNATDPANDPPVFPLVDSPDSSARGVLVYNREQFNQLPNVDADRRAFLEKAKPLYISRSLGEIVEGRQ